MSSEYKLSWLTIIILSGLYLCFPAGLSTVDGWYSAASIKYSGELFSPHHLLYNSLGLIFCRVASLAGIEVISSLKVMNALFAFLALIALRRILSLYKLNDRQLALIIGLAGISFSVMRFATENETYIVPLFFALIASLNYLKYLEIRGIKNLLFAGLWASVAILFHQTYVFWWFGLLSGFLLERNKRHILLYLVVSVIVPVAYLVVIVTQQGGFALDNVIEFLKGDFKSGATLTLTSRGIFFSVANLVRSFVQVHGYIFNMARENLLLLMPGVVSLVFFVFALLNFPLKGTINISRRFAFIHILILVLQYIFAVVSSGNAEFMVMIPVLVFMLFPFFAGGYEKFLLCLLIGMAIWNISYGLIPLHFRNKAPEQFLCDEAISVREPVIIASDDQLIKSMIYYQTGKTIINNVYKSPAVLSISRKDTANLDSIIVNALSHSRIVYTNCLDERTLSRHSIIEGSVNDEFFRKYDAVLTNSWMTFTGTSSVYRIELKQD